MCHLYPYESIKILWKFFYLNICGFISRGKFLYETRVLDNSYLRYKVQLPTSDNTEITTGGIKVTLEGPVPLDASSQRHLGVQIHINWKSKMAAAAILYLYLTRVALVVSET